MPFEHHRQPLLPWPRFLRRMAWSLAVGLCLIAASLGIGMIGYRVTMDLAWIDAFVNAAMILSGMGPLAPPQTDAAKIFAGLYALFSGLAVLAIAGIIFAPAVHRLLHVLHADPESRRG